MIGQMYVTANVVVLFLFAQQFSCSDPAPASVASPSSERQDLWTQDISPTKRVRDATLQLQTVRRPAVFSSADTQIGLEAIFSIADTLLPAFSIEHTFVLEYLVNGIAVAKLEMPALEWAEDTKRFESVQGIEHIVPKLEGVRQPFYQEILIEVVLATDQLPIEGEWESLTASVVVRIQHPESRISAPPCGKREPKESLLGLNGTQEILDVHARVVSECGCSAEADTLLAAEIGRILAPLSIVQVHDGVNGAPLELWCALQAVLCTFSLRTDASGNILLGDVKFLGALCPVNVALRQRASHKGMLSWAAEEPLPSHFVSAALVILDARGLDRSELQGLIRKHLPTVEAMGALFVRGLQREGWVGLEAAMAFDESKTTSCGGRAKWHTKKSAAGLSWDVYALPYDCKSGAGGAAVIVRERGINPALFRSWATSIVGHDAASYDKGNAPLGSDTDVCSNGQSTFSNSGDKWDVPALYINIDTERDEIMQQRIAELAPRAWIRRFEGKDGKSEQVCDWLSKDAGRLGHDSLPGTVCCTLSHWLAINEFFFRFPHEDFLVVLEDDVSFDLVPFWPGSLRMLLERVSQTDPGWQILNIAPSNDEARHLASWTAGKLYRPYQRTKGKPGGAVAYAVHRDAELGSIVRAAAACADPQYVQKNLAKCKTLLHAHSDSVIYDMTWAMAVTMPLLRIDASLRSLRKPGGLNLKHVRAADSHFTAWLFLQWIAQ